MYQTTLQEQQPMEVMQQLEALLADDFPSARSQLQRHISNSTSLHRKQISRISKPSSAGNSPQDYQRRRHTTSQSIPRQRRAVYQQCLQTPPTSQALSSIARPVSWHPSTLANQQHSRPSYSTNFSYGIPTPVTQPISTMPYLAKGLYNPEDPSGFYQQSSDYDIYRNSQTDNMMQGGYFNYQQETSAVFSPVMYSAGMPGVLASHATYTAPTTPDFLSAPTTETSIPLQRPALPRTESKELIGMGLYDGPDRNSWTLDSYMDDQTTRPLSLGKGLKLEETWEPPEEEDRSDDEEDVVEENQQKESVQEQLDNATQEAPQLPAMETSQQHSFFFTAQDAFNAQAGFQQMMVSSFPRLL